jgi:membrane protein YqaA with SNARE-associated domain
MFLKSFYIKLIKSRRRAFAWVESFANRPRAFVSLFIFSFLESFVSPFPTDLVYLPASIAAPKRALILALWSTVGSVFGGAIGYFIGAWLMESIGQNIVEFYNAQESWKSIVDAYQGDFGMWFVAIAAVAPIPYKISTIAAGATEMSFWPFLLISLLGRGGRFAFFGVLIYFFGEDVKKFMDKYSWLGITIMIVVIVGGFVAIKYVF